MNIFDIHRNIVGSYEEYIRSFVNISNERIRNEVEAGLSKDLILPEPLIQFNPSFKVGGSIDELISRGILNKHIGYCFKGWELFLHQTHAIEIGSRNESFVVTSGTGSGKSLTFLATIFNRILNEGVFRPGIKAVIVYPMNALINSQYNALNFFADEYKRNSGENFPIRFGRYTGQENETERDALREKPPHILLTNYMMLELILTRNKESKIVQAMYDNLQFLVFDELHTYRGRQGSDVAMLIRRIKAQCINKKMACIGTSATMASGEGTVLEQRKEVAIVATKMFGQEVKWDNVVIESLRESFPGPDIQGHELKEALQENIPDYGHEADLKNNRLARWIERNICLEKKEGIWFRAKPQTFEDIIRKISVVSQIDPDICQDKLTSLLLWADKINVKIEGERPRRSYLPYKIHQYIAQTGSVYVSLEEKLKRKISLEAKNKTSKEEGKLPMYQVVFSRYSGNEFICVSKNNENSMLEPVAFNSSLSEDEEADHQTGYILIEENGDEPIWDPVNDLNYLPDSWFNVSRQGGRGNIKSEHSSKLPVEIYFNREGKFQKNPGDGFIRGWFMEAPLAFDPTSQTLFQGKIREGNKLVRLGTEGRSTATTILSYLSIRELAKTFDDPVYHKLLCFTDVRQDAALQAGHFNDFIKVGMLRSAIYKAVTENNSLNYSNIDNAVFNLLNLEQDEYAKTTAEEGSFLHRENQKALKLYLAYRILYDLRRGWRVIMPNLEQVALVKIEYQELGIEAEKSKYDTLPGFNQWDAQKRYNILFQTLEFFRTSFAFYFEIYEHQEENRKIILNNLKAPWTLNQNEDIKLPFYLRVTKPERRKQNIHTLSIGALGAFGKFIKNELREVGTDNRGEELTDWIQQLLDLLNSSGYLQKFDNLLDVNLYQLNGNHIIWTKGDEVSPWEDEVRVRSLRKSKKEVNQFFQNFYRQNYKTMKPISTEHTGQLGNEDRIQAEEGFIDGSISVLYCSPTMELGVDISELNIVQMRNVPPNPSNYAQRSGRAGRSGQAALVLTYCANTSSHDRHYFENRTDMVSGIVTPPRFDLTQEELLLSHLNALFISRTNLGALNDSISNLLEMEVEPEKLTLKAEAKEALALNKSVIESLESIAREALLDIIPELAKMPSPWFNENWITKTFRQAPQGFDRALDRWRSIYQNCVKQLKEAATIIGDPRIPRTHELRKMADSNRLYAEKMLEKLRNENKQGKNTQLSEFYPYRYLASEGFLPGYGFTKLPVQLFIPTQKGDYISRPKFIALREFGPQSIVYHKGGKYRINQMTWSVADNPPVSAKIAKNSGYILMGGESNRNTCPITNADLTNNSNRISIGDMIEIRESRSVSEERITCEEEERQILGYDITTAFYLESGFNNIEEVLVQVDGEVMLRMQYLPSARIVQINNKWRITREGDGFLIGKNTGYWKKPSQLENRPENAEEIQRVKLYAETTADALYIYPTKNLNLNPFKPGVITLMYALKRAVETLFQIESNEMGVSLMGTEEEPNIFLFESAEGSLGVISQLVKDSRYIKYLFESAWKFCHFDKSEEDQQRFGTASYADLLSFYNQRHHNSIDRYLIKDALEVLQLAQINLVRSSLYKDYENQYQELLKHIDPTSSTELKFLNYLYKNNLRLPDHAQVNMSKYGCYTIPDFVYSEDIKVCVFCDGTPHDLPSVKESDSVKRACLENLGFEVLVWHYLIPLDQFVGQYPLIFKTARS